MKLAASPLRLVGLAWKCGYRYLYCSTRGHRRKLHIACCLNCGKPLPWGSR